MGADNGVAAGSWQGRTQLIQLVQREMEKRAFSWGISPTNPNPKIRFGYFSSILPRKCLGKCHCAGGEERKKKNNK
jgi:hypothetical protein